MHPRDRRRVEPAASLPGGGRRHVVFALAGVAYAVDAALVRRSLPVPETPVSDVAVLGQTFPLLDLRTLFRLPPSAEPGRLVLLVQTAGGRAGLIVDDLVQIAVLDASDVVPLPGAFRGVERNWFAGLTRLGSRVVVVVSPDALVAAGAVLSPVRPAEAARAR